jgi:hypothetical protein
MGSGSRYPRFPAKVSHSEAIIQVLSGVNLKDDRRWPRFHVRRTVGDLGSPAR